MPNLHDERRKFKTKIITEAFEVHDRECCTDAEPCDLRADLKQQLADIDKPVPERLWVDRLEQEARVSDIDAQGFNSSGVQTGYSATEPQLKLIRKLAVERLTDSLTKRLQFNLTVVVGGSVVPFKTASALITALFKCPENPNRPPTGNQLDYIRILADKLDQNAEPFIDRIATFAVASALIDKLKATAAKQPRASFKGLGIKADGMYRTPEGDIYKVQIAIYGSGRPYAKKLVQQEDGSFRFVKEDGAVERLTPEMKMTPEQAQEFGRLYGVCCRCGRTLTDEESIAYGIGPKCREHF